TRSLRQLVEVVENTIVWREAIAEFVAEELLRRRSVRLRERHRRAKEKNENCSGESFRHDFSDHLARWSGAHSVCIRVTAARPPRRGDANVSNPESDRWILSLHRRHCRATIRFHFAGRDVDGG